ncbi:uncharacterized protein MKK02DRAFT_26463 [Dioszegia hungarica]|uniref:Actin cytoskeleton-regulatory complex protein SLA1 n=1 Tax=Dioszegia hungarica TaxID=4972 RepID=A0AA38H974_9TREE|nr:uncharacterized protein MKK02DRAFT_26463 [Dioszegia hungarica]KAI9636713.1 hypothetical protein MKK02DRAFT_26463 [Dioszegia hungarica]
MAYVAVVKALYDYEAQDPETELALKEDQIAYVIEKEDEDWWKAKLKNEDGDEEGGVGLIPVSYVEELPPINSTRALYAYTSTTAEELSMEEDAVLQVFSVEEDWLLVRVEGGAETLGFVPRTYCEPLDESQEVEVADAAEAEADLEEKRQQEAIDIRQREASERQRQLKLKDKVETWSVSQMEGKKKKKGTLGVGNGAVFFASDTDKLTWQSPVQQISITDLDSVSSVSSKEIQLSISSLPAPLHFHCGGSDTAKAILAKLETSKEAAGEALQTIAAEGAADSDDYEPKAVRFAPTSSAASARAPAASSGEPATVLYDFDAQGEDELNVKENDIVTVVDKENDEWWLVRNSRGQEGVVPAQYIQIGEGSAPAAAGYDEDDEEEEARRAEEEATAQRQLDAERQRERSKQAEQRRAIEKAARAKQVQEEEDRQIALDLERREVERSIAQQKARMQEEEVHQEELSARRREVARHQAPPKIAKRPSANDVAAAAARLPDRGRAPPDRPPENSRPKPNPGRVRVWSDKSGQFKVEAEYLGLNGNKIRLHKTNGVIIEVPIDKMSQEDVQMIKRHETRRQQRRAAAEPEDDDVPLGRTPRKGQSSRSEESRARGEEPIPAAAMEQPKPRKPRFDWFAFFLEAGCSMDDCTRYAANFERDRIDETLLPDLEPSTLRSLGLKEGDVIRVRKEIQVRFAKKTPEQEAQIKQDEDYARQLQDYERSGGKGPIPQPPPALFTGPSGKLANNTRRGRPERKGTDTVDASAIAAAGDQLSKMNTGDSAPSPVLLSPSPPPPKQEKPAAPAPAQLIAGFDDDAWTIKPSSKPASPAPPASTPAPAALPPVVNGNRAATSGSSGTDSLFAQIQALRPAQTGMQSNSTGGSFGQSQMQPNQTGFSNSAQYGLGQQGTGQPMSQMMMNNPNAPRGPLAPVPSNEGLLNPLQPSQTGVFVPTRGSPAPMGQQGMMPQATGYGMMPQQTGYAAGFQQGYGQLQPAFTGMAGPQQQFGQNMHQQASSTFGSIANMGPPAPPQQQQQQQPQGDKFAPGNIFAAMKRQDFGKPDEQRPQDSGKYDALRPLTTGYNGAPGMMPQQTGMGMMPQQMGMMGGMGMQPTGMGQGMMGPQMTGYNPYAGQQNQYGGQYR